jgi:hypothetical protein
MKIIEAAAWERRLIGSPNFTEPPVLDVPLRDQATLIYKSLNASGN